jgi:hypothetical protein
MQSSAISGGAFDVPVACILDPLDPDTTVVNMAATKSESSVEADTFDGCRLCFWHFNENCIRHHTNIISLMISVIPPQISLIPTWTLSTDTIGIFEERNDKGLVQGTSMDTNILVHTSDVAVEKNDNPTVTPETQEIHDTYVSAIVQVTELLQSSLPAVGTKNMECWLCLLPILAVPIRYTMLCITVMF